MKKMQNVAVVLAAAALLALGTTSAFAAGWVQEGNEWRYQENSGDYVTETMKKSGDTTFYLDENGYMAKDFYLEHSNDQYYYFGSNGAMVTNTWVAVDPSVVSNSEETMDVCWFYFQENGKAFKAADNKVSKKRIDGKDYFFNQYGIMMTGWFKANGELCNIEEDDDWYTLEDDKYYAGADGVARGGWLAWTDGFVNDQNDVGYSEMADKMVLYFYFDPNNYKCVRDKKKNINGRDYRFSATGLMLTGWEYMESEYKKWNSNEPGYAYSDVQATSSNTYFSGEDDGHMVKRGWVYAVPSKIIDSEEWNNEDEEYFYFQGNGTMVRNCQRKINGKFYVFDTTGIMKTGLILLNVDGSYADSIDTDYTEGDMIIKKSYYLTDSDPVNDRVNIDLGNFNGATYDDGTGTQVTDGRRLHYYGDDGARITGNKVNIELADDTYAYGADNGGAFTGKKKDKYYSNGFLLKGSQDIRYAIAIDPTDASNKSKIRTLLTEDDIFPKTYATGQAESSATTKTIVLSSAGSKVKKGYKKDANGDFWLIDKNDNFVGVYNIDVRLESSSKKFQWRSEHLDSNNNTKQDWYEFATTPAHGLSGSIADHTVRLDNDYCANFYIIAE